MPAQAHIPPLVAYPTEEVSREVVQRAARRGVLFKRTAYNFVSLAHDEGTVDHALATLHEALQQS